MSARSKKSKAIRKILVFLFIIIVVGALISVVYFEFFAYEEKGFIEPIEASYLNTSPEIGNSIIQNPYMGFVTDARNTAPTLFPVKLAYAKISWAELEPSKGKYDFSEFEKKNNFDYWRKQGANIIIRFYMDEPEDTRHMNIPDWLYYEINEDGVFYNSKGRQGFSPNYSNQILMNDHKLAISALAKKYDNDDLITFVELGSIGHWGEWHTSSVDEADFAFPKTIITDEYVKDYIDNFKNKILMMRRPFAIAKANKFGLYNDSFGDILQTEEYFLDWVNKGYTDNNTGEKHPAMLDFWKISPSGGEFSNYPGVQYITNEIIAKTLKQLENSHTSWLGPSAPIYDTVSETEKANLSLILSKMGYCFSVSKANFKTNVPIEDGFDGEITILNSGIAPFYFNWDLKYKLVDMNSEILFDNKLDYNIKTLLPGEKKVSFNFPLDKKYYSGIYSTYFSIKNPKGNDELNLANTNFVKGKGIFCGETVFALANGLKTDSYKYNSYYNYINYTDNSVKIKAININKSKNENDVIKLFKTKFTKENFKLNFDFSTLSNEIKTLIFFAGENELLTVENSENEIILIAKDYEKIIKKPSFSNFSLNIKKESDSYSLVYKTENNKEEKISVLNFVNESLTQDFGVNILLQTDNKFESSVGVLEFK